MNVIQIYPLRDSYDKEIAAIKADLKVIHDYLISLENLLDSKSQGLVDDISQLNGNLGGQIVVVDDKLTQTKLQLESDIGDVRQDMNEADADLATDIQNGDLTLTTALNAHKADTTVHTNQPVSTTSSPTFAGLTLTGGGFQSLNVTGGVRCKEMTVLNSPGSSLDVVRLADIIDMARLSDIPNVTGFVNLGQLTNWSVLNGHWSFLDPGEALLPRAVCSQNVLYYKKVGDVTTVAMPYTVDIPLTSQNTVWNTENLNPPITYRGRLKWSTPLPSDIRPTGANSVMLTLGIVGLVTPTYHSFEYCFDTAGSITVTIDAGQEFYTSDRIWLCFQWMHSFAQGSGIG